MKGRAWLIESALPYWFERGIDRARGGFFDLVDHDGAPVPGRKRCFVQGRQLYVFLLAGELGWAGPWREAVEIGLAALRGPCRHEAGGLVHALHDDLTHAVTARDLYDQAFAAFALAHAGRVLRERALVEEAEALLLWLDESWATPPVGYREGELHPTPPRRQNPHMHLLEAALAVHDAHVRLGDAAAAAAALARAERYASWLAERFADARRGVLPEYFDEEWRPLADARGRVTEPGHHFEWAWLLETLRARGGTDHGRLGARLLAFGRAHGVDGARNVAVNEVDVDGRVLDAQARLWPQTERLKAALAAFERTGQTSEAAEACAAFDGLQPYLATRIAGANFDRMEPDGSFVPEPARASSMYHVVCAYAELLRVSGVDADA